MSEIKLDRKESHARRSASHARSSAGNARSVEANGGASTSSQKNPSDPAWQKYCPNATELDVTTKLHICRHSSPNAKLTDSCAVAFREPLHLAENRLEFDLDQDSRLRSAQQCLMGGASRVAPCAGAEKGTGSLCMNGHRRVRCARLRSEIDYHRTCLCDCGDVGWWFRPMSCSKPPALARIRWNI